MKDTVGTIIYIGKAKNLKNRVKSYFTKIKNRPQRLKHLVKQIVQIDFVITSSEVEAFLLEATLIKKHKPKYNIRLKDDKSYPYIKCTLSEEYPRFYLSRRVNTQKDLFYGPFTSSFLVRENIKFLNGFYKIRDCSNGFMKSRKRPCITYEIKKCSAPCVGLVNKEQYQKQIHKALKFLDGETDLILKEVEQKMIEASKREDYELAAEYRDQLKSAQIILEKQTVVTHEKMDKDVVSCLSGDKGFLISMVHARKGRVIGQKSHYLSKLNAGVEVEPLREKLVSFLNQYYADNFIPDAVVMDQDLGKDLTRLFKEVLKERKGSEVLLDYESSRQNRDLLKLAQNNAKEHIKKFQDKSQFLELGLEEIKERFDLESPPLRIECYDISNFQGTESVGSQVVFHGGTPSPEDYRIYKIKTVEGSNDFASIKEVLTRRLNHKEYQNPDLIVIDGGKGQLAKAKEVLKELGREDLKIVGLAKSREKGSFDSVELKRTQERFFIPGRANPVVFKSHSPAFKVLTHLRDEAHRFAITHHRKRRDKKFLDSELKNIKGLGEKKLKKLKEVLSLNPDWQSLTVADIKKELSLSEDKVKKIFSILKVEKN